MAPIKAGSLVNSTLANTTILDQRENKIILSSLWDKQATLLVFIRHFGCFGCATQMAALAPRLSDIEQLGIQVVLIGNGAPHFIEGFKERYFLHDKNIAILTDPSLQVYKNAGLTRSHLIAFGPTTWYERIIALSKGYSNKNQGDDGQMGGTMLVDKNGTIAFYYRNKTVANHANPHLLMDAIQKFVVANKKN